MHHSIVYTIIIIIINHRDSFNVWDQRIVIYTYTLTICELCNVRVLFFFPKCVSATRVQVYAVSIIIKNINGRGMIHVYGRVPYE